MRDSTIKQSLFGLVRYVLFLQMCTPLYQPLGNWNRNISQIQEVLEFKIFIQQTLPGHLLYAKPGLSAKGSGSLHALFPPPGMPLPHIQGLPSSLMKVSTHMSSYQRVSVRSLILCINHSVPSLSRHKAGEHFPLPLSQLWPVKCELRP